MTRLPPEKRRGWAAFLLGRAWFEKARDDIARGHLEQAIKLWPELALAHRYLSYVCLRAEQFEEGLACSSRACELDIKDRGLHWEHTQFHTLKEGCPVNLEFDILGKYILKNFQSRD